MMSKPVLIGVIIITCVTLLAMAWMQMAGQSENKAQTQKQEGRFGKNIKCLPGVTRFSSGRSPRHFYECSAGLEAIPELQECADGLIYMMDRQECLSKVSKKDKAIDAAALGRNFQLGSLYDVRSNMFFPDASFWDHKTIEANLLQYNKMEVNTAFNADKTVMEKMSHMDISAQLTMDFLGGLVHVSGSAGYLRDDVSVDNELNVEMTFHTTKIVKTLEKYVKKDHPEECKNRDVTHVVSSVIYGLDAVFVFKRVIQDHEKEEHVKGSLHLSVSSIPGFSISGGGSVNLTDEQRGILNTTSLKMYGDFSPDQPLPSSFDEAVVFYKNLPTLAGTAEKNWAGTSILQVHLTPITQLCTDAEYIYNEISDSLMSTVSDMLDKMEELNMKAGGLMAKRPPRKFLPLRQNLNIYKVSLESYRMNKKRKLQEILPNIRGGTGKGEDDLFALVQDFNNSTFEFELSSMFLVNRSREIEAITIVLDNFPEASNILITDYESATDVECIIARKYVVILEINILTPKSLTENFLAGIPMDESDFWFNKKEEIGHVGSLLRNYSNFALDNVDKKDGCYLINLLPLIKDHPTTTKAMINGLTISDKFEVPVAPNAPKYYKITHNSFQFKITKTLNFVIGCKVIITDFLGNNSIIEQEMLFTENTTAGEDIEIRVNSLKPARLYSFRAKLMTQVGTGPPSPPSSPFTTAPSSSPQSLAPEKLTSSSVQVKWLPPAIIGKEIPQDALTYKIEIRGDDDFYNRVITSDLNATFTGLLDATNYKIEARAGVDLDIDNYTNVISESLPTSISLFSSPLPPKMFAPLPAQVSDHVATVHWEPPKNVAKGSFILHYLLEYSAMDQNGTKSMTGTSHQIVVNETKYQVTDLAQGQLYAFRAKVVTSAGESDFSLPSLVKTHFNQSELDRFRDKIAKNLISPMIKESEEKIETEISTMKSSISEMELALMPVGSIIAWVGRNNLGQEIPVNWQRCDGSNITRGLMMGHKTPNLNGEGRFLRGGAENAALSFQDDALEDHTHLDYGHSHTDSGHGHTDKGHGHQLDSSGHHYPSFIGAKDCKSAKTQLRHDHGWCMNWNWDTLHGAANIEKGFAKISHTKSGVKGVSGGRKATETRPKNMHVVYIMRIK